MTRLPSTSATALLLLAVACSKAPTFSDERPVPKDSRPTEFGQSQKERFGLEDMAPAAGAAAGAGAGYQADAPAHWQPAPRSQFRDLVWHIDGDPAAECYLTAEVGGDLLDNVNRWCVQQFGLAAMTAAQVAALPKFPLLGDQALLVELHGTFRGKPDTKMLVLARHQNGQLRSTFRLTAPSAIADRERAAFLQVGKSIRAGAAAPVADALRSGPKPATLPPGHPTDVGGPVASPHGSGGAPAPGAPFAATIPAGWQPLADTGSKLLRHRFGSKGECYVGQLGGDAVQIAGIWYAEMGQQAPDAHAIEQLGKQPLLGGQAALIDVRGNYRGMSGEPIQDARLLVAVLDTGSGVVFAKCLGPAAEVTAQQQAFLAFCASLKRTGE